MLLVDEGIQCWVVLSGQAVVAGEPDTTIVGGGSACAVPYGLRAVRDADPVIVPNLPQCSAEDPPEPALEAPRAAHARGARVDPRDHNFTAAEPRWPQRDLYVVRLLTVPGAGLRSRRPRTGSPDAMIEAWQGQQWVRARTGQDGVFRITVRKPRPVRTGDGRLHAPHLNVAVFATGLLKQAMTRLYFPDERQANEQDPVLKRLPPQDLRLVARRENDVLRFDIHLQGDNAAVFFEF
ncbi:hypothetical protein [Actinomadura sp. B10D3]|uniref:hypothetical protein n=1 Tax=Actinomadura sp. B10D3 TaxID=3153557 RepID=UPI00325C706A